MLRKAKRVSIHGKFDGLDDRFFQLFFHKCFKYLIPMYTQKSHLALVPFHCSFEDVEIESWETGKSRILFFFTCFSWLVKVFLY